MQVPESVLGKSRRGDMKSTYNTGPKKKDEILHSDHVACFYETEQESLIWSNFSFLSEQ